MSTQQKQSSKKQDDVQEHSIDIDTQSEELVACQSERDSWKTKYLRALADYQNLDKRTREEKEEIWKFAAERILLRLFPAMDTFTKAKEHIKDPGLDLVWKELHAVISEQGVEKIQSVGKSFDPHEMECIEVAEGKEGIVVEEVLAGYRLHNKVLRVAQVKVGGKK